jgi:hypothetical protein
MKQGDKRYLLAISEGESNLLRAITRPDADGNQKTTDMKISIHDRHEHQPRLWRNTKTECDRLVIGKLGSIEYDCYFCKRKSYLK